MGTRAVVVVSRDEEAARMRFGVTGEGLGVVVTRTGRPFFKDDGMAVALLDRVRSAIDRADLWAKLDTTWLCIDAELMPWSLKAQELVRGQYAAVAAASDLALKVQAGSVISHGPKFARRCRSSARTWAFGSTRRSGTPAVQVRGSTCRGGVRRARLWGDSNLLGPRGAIWRVSEKLALDAAIREAVIAGQNVSEVRAGFSWAIP